MTITKRAYLTTNRRQAVVAVCNSTKREEHGWAKATRSRQTFVFKRLGDGPGRPEIRSRREYRLFQKHDQSVVA